MLSAHGDGRTSEAEAAALLGPVDGALLSRAFDELRELALVWGTDGAVHLVTGVAEALGPYPAGLGRPAVQLGSDPDTVAALTDATRLAEPAEQALAQTIARLEPEAQAQFVRGDFAASLATLAQARDAVDAFFADIMVMAEDPAVRANRLALLAGLHGIMNQVADISRLAQ